MNFDNPLYPVYRAFQVAQECINVVMDSIRDRKRCLVDCSNFLEGQPEQWGTALEEATAQAADLAVFALFATFERYVVEHLQTAHRLLGAGYPKQYASRLALKFEGEVEYWRFAEVLDLFKGEVDPELVGRVKQIKQYRDWIAHRNPNKPPPKDVSPQDAFDALCEMIDQIRYTHSRPAGNERLAQDVAVPL